MMIGVRGLTVRVSVLFPVPPSLVAERVMVVVAAVVGVPEMTPVSGLIFKPAGRPVAVKRAGALMKLMAKRKG